MKKDSSRLLLLDVNVLLALAWPNHQFHAAATGRLERSRERWATCALTELGFIRLSSNSAAVAPAKTPVEAAALLGVLIDDPLHVFLESLPSPVGEEFRASVSRILGSKQVTDAYLLFLARRSGAVFVTFDTRLRALAGQDTETEVITG
jgi:toxin-antitoxin system PIN domain toxin